MDKLLTGDKPFLITQVEAPMPWIICFFSPSWQPSLTGQSAAKAQGSQPWKELAAPPKGAQKICKLLQLLLPPHISFPLLTTRQTSCLCLINKLLYLFRGVNLYLLWFKWHWHDIFSFFPLLLKQETKIHRKKKSQKSPPKQLLCILVHEINKCIS